MTWMAYIGLALAVFILWHLLHVLLWPSWSDIPREQFAHQIHSLIRFYKDSTSLLIAGKQMPLDFFRFRRAGTKGDGCDLIFEILDSPLASQHHAEVIDAIESQGYEAIIWDDQAEVRSPISVNLEITDIWRMDAGNKAARLAHATLDAMGVDKEARFRIIPPKNSLRSRERTLEARRRQRAGLDLGGIGLKK